MTVIELRMDAKVSREIIGRCESYIFNKKLRSFGECFISKNFRPLITLLKILRPPHSQKKNSLFIGFLTIKTTSLSSRFQHKNRFWTGSGDINQNVLKSGSPNQTCIFWDVFANISGPGAYFSKPIFVLKPWAQAGCFEYHEPYIRKIFFGLIMGSWNSKKVKKLRLECSK